MEPFYKQKNETPSSTPRRRSSLSEKSPRQKATFNEEENSIDSVIERNTARLSSRSDRVSVIPVQEEQEMKKTERIYPDTPSPVVRNRQLYEERRRELTMHIEKYIRILESMDVNVIKTFRLVYETTNYLVKLRTKKGTEFVVELQGCEGECTKSYIPEYKWVKVNVDEKTMKTAFKLTNKLKEGTHVMMTSGNRITIVKIGNLGTEIWVYDSTNMETESNVVYIEESMLAAVQNGEMDAVSFEEEIERRNLEISAVCEQIELERVIEKLIQSNKKIDEFLMNRKIPTETAETLLYNLKQKRVPISEILEENRKRESHWPKQNRESVIKRLSMLKKNQTE